MDATLSDRVDAECVAHSLRIARYEAMVRNRTVWIYKKDGWLRMTDTWKNLDNGYWLAKCWPGGRREMKPKEQWMDE